MKNTELYGIESFNLGLGAFVVLLSGPAFMPVLKALLRVGFCEDDTALVGGACGGRNQWAWITAAAVAGLLLVSFTIRVALTDFDLGRLEVRANLADWSGDAQLQDGTTEQKHALTSKSVRYDVAKICVKIALAAAKMYVPLLLGSEIVLACVVACGGAVLLHLGWRFDQFYEADLPGGPQLPLRLNANGIQTAVDAGIFWIYLSQLAVALGVPNYVSAGVFVVIPIGYACRVRKVGGHVAVQSYVQLPAMDAPLLEVESRVPQQEQFGQP